MAFQKVKFRASVGRQNFTKNTAIHEANYVSSIKQQFKQITDNYEKVVAHLKTQSADILLDALRPTYDLSQVYVPVDTGALKQSGFLEKDTRSRFPRVVMGYGKGGNPNYATLVHELVHHRHASPTKAKFLLSALEEDAGNIQKRIVENYRRSIGL